MPRILYAVQGTGNGLISRANEIVPILNGLAPTNVLIISKHTAIKWQTGPLTGKQKKITTNALAVTL